MRLAQVVVQPLVQMLSLSATGTPASGKLLRDGSQRANRLLERWAADGLPVHRAGDTDAEQEVGSRRALELAGSTLVVALLLAAGAPEAPVLGLNLWTAQWLFLAVAGGLLAATLGKLSWRAGGRAE